MGKRKLYLDVVKVWGVFSIILLHTLSNTIHEAYPFVSSQQVSVVHSIHQLLYTAVPMFLLATGAGFLAEKGACGYDRMKGHICKIAVDIVLFGAFFWIVECVLSGGSINVKDMVLAILTDATWSHTWYLYRILGIYLLMPLLAAFMNHAGSREQVILAGVLLFLESLYPYAAGLIGFVPAAVSPIDGIFVFYVLAGGIIGRAETVKFARYRWWLLASTVISGVMVLGKGFQGQEYILKEDYPMSLIFAVCLFTCVKIWCEKADAPHIAGEIEQADSPCIAGRIAKASLGIYILHPAVIHFLVKIVGWNPQYKLPVLMLPMMALVVLLVTYVTVSAARKVPFVRKYIL